MAAPTTPSPENRFRYSASARALTIEITAPFEASPDAGACELPVNGEFQHMSWDRINVPRILQIRRVYADTAGEFDEEENAWQTTVRLTIEKFSLSDVLSIGRMSADLISSYPVNAGPPTFSISKPMFEDVRLGGIPAQVVTDPEIYSRSFTYDELKSGEVFKGAQVRKALDDSGRAIFSFVERLRMEGDLTSFAYVDGNLIVIPGLGRVRLGELAVEPQRCTLKLFSADFEAAVRGRADVGILTINGVAEGDMSQEEPEEDELEPASTNLDEEQEGEVMEALSEWLNTEPEPDSPFLFFMGHSLTPRQFFHEVEEKTRFGTSFLRFLSDQSKRFGEHPRDAIRRATDANQAE